MSKRDRYNIVIYRGETFSTLVELKDASGAPINLTGSQIQSQCRNRTSNAVEFSFVCTIQSPASSGKFLLSLPSSSSSSITPQKNLVYDVKISWTGADTKFWLGGEVEVRDTVTA
jgi:hypothetical protein